jgi:hypothetical protein
MATGGQGRWRRSLVLGDRMQIVISASAEEFEGKVRERVGNLMGRYTHNARNGSSGAQGDWGYGRTRVRCLDGHQREQELPNGAEPIGAGGRRS